MESFAFNFKKLLVLVALIKLLGICTCRPITIIDNNLKVESVKLDDGIELVNGGLIVGNKVKYSKARVINSFASKDVANEVNHDSARVINTISLNDYVGNKINIGLKSLINYNGDEVVEKGGYNTEIIEGVNDRARVKDTIMASNDDVMMQTSEVKRGLKRVLPYHDGDEEGSANVESNKKEVKVNYGNERVMIDSNNRGIKVKYDKVGLISGIKVKVRGGEIGDNVDNIKGVGGLESGAGVKGVPALLIFGDSTVDAGTNNHLLTISRSDFTPYGRDLSSKQPTGRFSNGLLVTDYMASMMGLRAHTVAYLDIKNHINQGGALLEKTIEMEVSFASASSGIYDSTALHFNALPLSKQLDHFKEYRDMLIQKFGKIKSLEILKRAIFIVSTGTNDFLNNYLFNPYLRAKYTPKGFEALLLGLCAQFIQELYDLGARRIGLVSLPPFGCLPAMITLYMHTGAGCVEHLNEQATQFNKGLQKTIDALQRQLNGLELAYMDSYNVLFNAIHNPKEYGLKHTQKACCGSGKLEAGPFCNKLALGTCEDATSYAFWDSFHSTDRMNQILALELFEQLWIELHIEEPYAYYCKQAIMNDVSLKA